MNKRKLLKKAISRSRNIRFTEAKLLAEAFGFRHVRTSGSHHIFSHPAVDKLLNLQDVGGQPKPYQIRQMLRMVERYNLLLEENDE